MAVDVGSAVGYLDLDISGFLKNLKSAQDEADKQSKNIATKIGGNLSGVGKTLTSVGTTLTKNVTVPLLGVGAAGLKVATNFEKGMSEVKAISGATGKDFEALRQTAIQLGADTAFSANEVAAGMTEMAKAGWSSQQIIDGMSGVLAAAAASGEGLASVSTIVADAITGFGLSAKDSSKIADLLTQAANSGTIGITDLGESFKYIAPVAGSMGLSVEDVTTAISAMSMAGIKGSQAGTALRTMLTNMVKPTDKMAIAMDELGISATNSDGSMKSLDEIVSNLRTSFDGLTEAEKAKYAATIAGKEGMSGMLALLNLTEEQYNDIATSMDNAGGVAETTAAIMQDNLQSKVEQLGGALESLAIKLADYVIPYVQQFVVWLTGLIDKFIALDPETQKTILKFAGLAAAIGPVVAIFGKITSGAGSVFTAFGKLSGGFKAVTAGGHAGAGAFAKLGGAIAGITAPMVAVVAVIGVLVAAFTSLWKNNEEFRNKVTEIWNQVKTTFSTFAQGIVDRLNSLGFNFSSITEVLKAIWQGFCNFLAPVFTGAFQLVANTFQTITSVILGIVDFFIAIFKGDWQGAWDAVRGIFTACWQGIISFFTNIGNTLNGILNVVCGWFGTTWSATWDSIKTFFINTWNTMRTTISTALTTIQLFIVNTWNAVSNFFTTIWTSISTFVVNVWNGIKTGISNALTTISTVIMTVWNSVKVFFTTIWTSISTFISTIWNGIKTSISNAIDTIKTTITNVFNAIKTTILTVLNAIWTTITTIWNGIKTTVSTVTNGISTTISNTWNGIKTTISTVLNSVKTTVSNVFSSISMTVTSTWNGIKDTISNSINAAKTTVSNVVTGIKTTISNGFTAAKTTVSNVFGGIKNSISGVMDNAKSAVSNAISNIKKKFNFSWSLPKLKMPKVSISGKFSLNPLSVPKFGISWHKKAMNNGMILDTATIFGFDQKTGKFLGGGEAGSETVVGTNSLLNMIKQAVRDAVGPLVQVSRELARTSAELGYVTYNGFVKLKEAKEVQSKVNQNNSGNGDTFVFYSPKAIDEIEAAKQMKKTKRELAEGF